MTIEERAREMLNRPGFWGAVVAGMAMRARDGFTHDGASEAAQDDLEAAKVFATAAPLLAKALTQSGARNAALEWQPIETAPEVEGKYFFCRLAWGPDEDKCTGEGFRWNGRWFAAANFHKGARSDECQNEIRQIEVSPTHWQPLPASPALIKDPTDG